MLYSEICKHRAADLPEGSVVANTKTAWIKHFGSWLGTNGARFGDAHMDDELAGGPGGSDLAVVLRVGTGEVVS